MILTVAAIAAVYLYLAVLAWRLGHSGKHGQKIWSTPRPRLRSHGAHTKPRTPKPATAAEPEQVDTTGLAVAA